MITIEGVSLLQIMFAVEVSRRTPVASDGAYKSGRRVPTECDELTPPQSCMDCGPCCTSRLQNFYNICVAFLPT